MSDRFRFGKNWQSYLNSIDETRIRDAEESLRTMLGVDDLNGRSFLDMGSGSGLFSLAANRLGARVRSFDYDADCVSCTTALRDRFGNNSSTWIVEQGSALDETYLRSLGAFDVVYSWGVLHHTGDMWRAIANTIPLVRPGGLLFIALYNDQGGSSRRWAWIKRQYNRSPSFLKWMWILSVGIYFESRAAAARIVHRQNPFKRPDQGRGMTAWHDLVDWVGGYPFETARPDDVANFFFQKNFTLQKLKTVGDGHGCNEYVFRQEKT